MPHGRPERGVYVRAKMRYDQIMKLHFTLTYPGLVDPLGLVIKSLRVSAKGTSPIVEELVALDLGWDFQNKTNYDHLTVSGKTSEQRTRGNTSTAGYTIAPSNLRGDKRDKPQATLENDTTAELFLFTDIREFPVIDCYLFTREEWNNMPHSHKRPCDISFVQFDKAKGSFKTILAEEVNSWV